MNTAKDESRGAVAGQVERGIRPLAGNVGALQALVDRLRAEFPGYHLELTLYPSGGTIDAEACEECGTTLSGTESWRYKSGVPLQTLDDAVVRLKTKLDPSP